MMAMEKMLGSYYEMLRGLTRRVAITDKAGHSIGLEQGFKKTIRLLTACAKSGRKLIFIGNGASASISSHMAVDFWKNAGIKATAFNDHSLLTCISNDYGYEQVFAKPVEIFSDKGDILIAISSSGRSENILRAVGAAKPRGVKIVTLTGFSKDNPLRKRGDMNFYVPADRYSHVEIIHHSLCHYMLDALVDGGKK